MHLDAYFSAFWKSFLSILELGDSNLFSWKNCLQITFKVA